MDNGMENSPDKEVYLAQILGELKGRIDTFITMQERHLDNHERLEERVTFLEKSNAKLLGVTITAATAVSFAGWLIQNFVIK